MAKGEMTEGEMTEDSTQFDAPRVAINRVYTKQGDSGSTRLVGGQKRAKHDIRIEAFGTVDELNAVVGSARCRLLGEAVAALLPLGDVLLRIQHELFNLGSILATLPEDIHPQQARVTEADVLHLEAEIDDYNANLGTLRSFVLPGGSELEARLHLCRTVCRRAERRIAELLEREPSLDPLALAYLNRLSDAFFVWGRWALAAAGAGEVLWDPNRG